MRIKISREEFFRQVPYVKGFLPPAFILDGLPVDEPVPKSEPTAFEKDFPELCENLPHVQGSILRDVYNAPGKSLPRTDLLKYIGTGSKRGYEGRNQNLNTLASHISQMRRKLEKSTFPYTFACKSSNRFNGGVVKLVRKEK